MAIQQLRYIKYPTQLQEILGLYPAQILQMDLKNDI